MNICSCGLGVGTFVKHCKFESLLKYEGLIKKFQNFDIAYIYVSLFKCMSLIEIRQLVLLLERVPTGECKLHGVPAGECS